MDLSTPASVLLGPGEARALTVLTGTTRPLSGREVAKLGGASPSTTWRALQSLTKHGVVRVQEAGSGAALLYTLNRNHVASEAILILVRLRQRLFDRLTGELEGWRVPPMHASVFGSAARRDGDTESDVDLFIVRRAHVQAEGPWRDQLDRLPSLVLAWSGNHAGIAEVSEEDLLHLARERPPVVGELERDGITLIGPSVHELFMGVPQ